MATLSTQSLEYKTVNSLHVVTVTVERSSKAKCKAVELPSIDHRLSRYVQKRRSRETLFSIGEKKYHVNSVEMK